ncbi:MAG: class I SAM-dependent methyltransferase [Methylococcales bacterium]|nr:class I SAM-dependent methyltransferase [Methylococcales bacterium]
MKTDFYQAFEEKYRGSPQVVQERLRVYFPFIESLRTFFPNAKAVDLGCGRGEWLGLLEEWDIDAIGVDIDENMLALARKKNFKVQNQDAIDFLKSLANESQFIISGFHIAEHIPFSKLQTLVEEALRVLKPGGLLILETPNPENIIVGTSNFYLDPTHKNPLPPLLLSFLPEYYGFEKTKILRLQEPNFSIKSHKDMTLLNVFSQVSLDYAIVAQKLADKDLMLSTQHAFDKNYGLELENLTNLYDQQIEAKIQIAINRLYNSHSWRITTPLRWIVMQIKLLFPSLKNNKP